MALSIGILGRRRLSPAISLVLAAALHPIASTPAQAPALTPNQTLTQKQEKKLDQELTVDRVSAEPDSDRRELDLRWSADGKRAAWMRWHFSGGSAADPLPQREIWTFPSSSALPPAGLQGAPGDGVLFVSADQVTKALVGNTLAKHRSLDPDDDEDNPYLLNDFAWSRDHNSLILLGARSIAVLEISSGKSKLLFAGEDPLADLSLSPNGQTVSFLRDHKLWLVPLTGGHPRLLTPAKAAGVLEGEADWPYRNELHLGRAYQWSPDSARVAYLETDDREVAKYTVQEADGDSHEISYPKPGGKLPLVQVFVRLAAGGPAVRMEVGPAKDFYIPRIQWLPDGRHLAIQRLDRYQHTLQLLLADSVTGAATTLLTEKNAYWINLADDLYFFEDGNRFLWSSERSGFRHLYLYDIHGHESQQITHGDWEVTQFHAVDEAASAIYFSATVKSPMERHLYRIQLDGSALKQMTSQPGTHEILFASTRLAADAGNFVDLCSSATERPRLLLESIRGDTIGAGNTQPDQVEGASPALTASATPSPSHQVLTHHDQAPQAAKSQDATTPSPSHHPDPTNPLNLQPIEFVPIQLHLGMKTNALLIRPPDFDPSHKYPVIVYLAGGPGEQVVRDAWGGATGLWMQLMAQKGYIVFALDNHGTAGRGHYFEEPIHLRLGAQELVDQRDGLVYLTSLPYVDIKRLGVSGWGYGGFLVLHAMLDRPVAFKAGFAGAPIVDWRLYDATFAERYLDDTVRHADGWLASLAFDNNSPRFFHGSLMLAQGGGDEFVHMENIFLIQNELLKAGKSANLLLFPYRGHSIDDSPSRRVLFQKMTDFFVSNL